MRPAGDNSAHSHSHIYAGKVLYCTLSSSTKEGKAGRRGTEKGPSKILYPVIIG
jgi:hypothetical protein